MVAVEGLTTIETSAGGPTVRMVELLTEPWLAWIVVLPWNKPIAKPLPLTVATVVVEEVQVTVAVTSCVLPSV